MSEGKDRDWLPTQAVKFWTKRYAKKRYQRKAGRLIKIGSDSTAENLSELGDLAQASTLCVSLEDLTHISAPISRIQSLEDLGAKRDSERRGSIEVLTYRQQGACSDPIANLVREVPKMDQEAQAQALEQMLARVGLGERDNHKLLPPLPYFNGSVEKTSDHSSQKPWIVYNCETFLSAIEDAVDNEKWTEAGKIKTLQDRLLGSARIYWSVKGPDVNTLARAREYLLRRYPNKETHTYLDNQITNFKRNRGETIPEMATRVQVVYTKLVKAVPESQALQQKNMKELFLKNLPEVVRDQMKEADTFDEVVTKSITYLERHKELKLRDQDVLLETTFKTDVKINNMNASGEGFNGNKKKNKGKIRENSNKQVRFGGNTANINNVNSDNNSFPNQRGFRGNTRRGFRDRGGMNYRGNFNSYNSFGNSSDGNTRGRGMGFRGYLRGNRYQRFRSYPRTSGFGNRGFQRGNSSGSRPQNSSNSNNAAIGKQCFSCNRFGHFSRDCTRRNRTSTNRSTTGSQNQTGNRCFVCGSEQHFARSCPQKN